MKRASVATVPGLVADDAPFAIGQRVRIGGLDRYQYTIAARRKLTCRSGSPGMTWEFLLHDMHGRPSSWVFADKLRTVRTSPDVPRGHMRLSHETEGE